MTSLSIVGCQGLKKRKAQFLLGIIETDAFVTKAQRKAMGKRINHGRKPLLPLSIHYMLHGSSFSNPKHLPKNLEKINGQTIQISDAQIRCAIPFVIKLGRGIRSSPDTQNLNTRTDNRSDHFFQMIIQNFVINARVIRIPVIDNNQNFPLLFAKRQPTCSGKYSLAIYIEAAPFNVGKPSATARKFFTPSLKNQKMKGGALNSSPFFGSINAIWVNVITESDNLIRNPQRFPTLRKSNRSTKTVICRGPFAGIVPSGAAQVQQNLDSSVQFNTLNNVKKDVLFARSNQRQRRIVNASRIQSGY